VDGRSAIGIGATAFAGVLLAVAIFFLAGARPKVEPPPEPDIAPRLTAERAPVPIAAPAQPPAPTAARAVSCGLSLMADGSRGDLPTLERAEIAYEHSPDDDPDHPPTFEVDVHEDRIAFDPPPGVFRGMFRAQDFLETSLAWSEAGCSQVLLRPAARISGRVMPSWGEPQVIGCGTSARVRPDGQFEMRVAPGNCSIRAVRDDDGVLVDSDPVQIDAQWDIPIDVDLLLPED
jgi:hypothetical protein